FGIFLTPVFFYVIAGFSEIPLFHSMRWLRFAAAMRFGAGLLSFGIAHRFKRRHPRPHPEVTVGTNGDGGSNGSSASNGHGTHKENGAKETSRNGESAHEKSYAAARDSE